MASIADETEPLALMLAGTRAATAGSFGGVGIVTAALWAAFGVANAVPMPGTSSAAPDSATAMMAAWDLMCLCGDLSLIFMCISPRLGCVAPQAHRKPGARLHEVITPRSDTAIRKGP